MPTPAHSRRVIEGRINLGLSQIDLARSAGIGRETVRLVEGGFVPTPRIQFAIATVLEVKPTDIWPLDQQPAMRRKPAKRTPRKQQPVTLAPQEAAAR